MKYHHPPVVVTPPAGQVLDLSEVKSHLRVEHDDEDDYISALIATVTQHLNGYSGVLNQALLTQTLKVDYRCFPHSRILRFPTGPVQSVSSVVYYDTADVQQTFNSAYYSLHEDVVSPYVFLKDTYVWPLTYHRPDAVQVTYVAGFGNSADVPMPIKQAMLIMISDLYEYRESISMNNFHTMPIPLSAKALLANYRKVFG